MGISSPSPEEIFSFAKNYSNRLFKSSRWNMQDREDFTQELAIVLMRAAERFDPSKNVPWEAFLNIRARGYLLDWYRRIKPEEPVWISDTDDEMVFIGVTYDDLSHIWLNDSIKNLEPRRRFVALCLERGYSRTEIADFLKVSQSRVTRLIHDIERELLPAS